MTVERRGMHHYTERVVHIPQDYSIFDKLLRFCLIMIVFSQPFRGVLPSLYGIHSFAYWITGIALFPALLRFPHIVRAFVTSKPMLILFVVHCWSVILYFLKPLHTNLYVIARTFDLWILTTLFLYIAHDIKWRKWLIWSYWLGWCLFLLYSYLDFFGQGLTICPTCRWHGSHLIAGFTYNTHGAEVALGIIIAVILLSRSRHSFLRIALFASIATGAIALLFSASRGAVVTLILTSFAWYAVDIAQAFQKRQNARFLLGFAASIGAILILSLTLLEPAAILVQRFSYRIDRTIEDRYFSGRDEILLTSLELASKNFIGIGQSNAMIRLGNPEAGFDGRVGAHNDYTKTLLEAGWVGFAFFVIAILSIIRRGWDWFAVSNSPDYFWPLILLLLVTAVGQGFYLQTTWIFLAMNAITPARLTE